MALKDNITLEQYEIKKPDYDFVDRAYTGMADVSHEPKRYADNNGVWKPKKKQFKLFAPKTARIMFTGDITCFEKQFEQAKKGEDYDFSYEFDAVRPVFAEADLVVGNLETMIVPYAPYRTEKYVAEQNFHCNAPLEFLEAVYGSGIDMVTNANNHDLDTGAVGIGETIDNIEKFGLIQTGTFKTEKKRYELIEVNGFRVAVTAFATEHNNKKCNLTEEGIDFILNDYSKEKAEKILKEARADGAEVVITCIHWGKENKIVQNKTQEKTAKELAVMGYDCIIGSHPHVLQPFSLIKTEDREVPVFYSMGNFLSHNVDNQKSRSAIAILDLSRENKKVSIKCSYIPVFTSKNYGTRKYVVLPMSASTSNKNNLSKFEKIKDILGSSIEVNKDINFKEHIEKMEIKLPKKKAAPLDLTKETPFDYDDGKYIYDVHGSFAVVKAISPAASTLSYTLPAKLGELPVSGIAAGCFENNSLIRKMNFKKNITFIPERMFKNCTSLEGFQLSGSTTIVKSEAFKGCTSLSAVILKDNVKTVESRAFADCTSLRSVKITAGVENIAEDAFDGCSMATFYCEEGSYGYEYAKSHNYKVAVMKIY